MNVSRATLLIAMILIFSWPIFLQQDFSPWFIWLYPFASWLLLILLAIWFDPATKDDQVE
ncbi:MAG: hypothetical protein JKY50_13615 [Oleispira sp.]|nr:hypothetical protein [Oleispira sp.]MBL4882445.1 hypothetical protein [Oleispira sp.]